MTLTSNDLKLIEEVISQAIDNSNSIAKKVDLDFLPTKDEFYEQTDKIMKELKDMREETAVLTSRVYDNHEPRIKKIERKLNLQAA